jgi:hypothetical protein
LVDENNSIELITNQITIIMNAMDEDQCYSCLNETDFLLKMIPSELQKEKNVFKLHRRIKNFLLNQDNVRILRLMQKIKSEPETSVEYYDRDYGSDERLLFQNELEADLLITYDEIKTFLSWLIREQINGEIEL